MKCPIDGETLVITDRQGVEIDYCPKCRGVWLDRGELDKILDRSAAQTAPQARPEPPRDSGYRDRDDRHRNDGYRHEGKPYRKKKRESFLDDLFDF